ncbi:MAG: invasion protein [Methylococcales bacterium]|nr:MAG: invasion protein [Methylococcales bacterium]
MLKTLHLTFILLSLISFVGRVILSEVNPELLKLKVLKIAPHILNALLIGSGFVLVFQGDWLSGDFGWIIAKLLVLIAYIGLGLFVMKSQGTKKWVAFIAAMACIVYIGIVAVTKNPWFFI